LAAIYLLILYPAVAVAVVVAVAFVARRWVINLSDSQQILATSVCLLLLLLLLLVRTQPKEHPVFSISLSIYLQVCMKRKSFIFDLVAPRCLSKCG